MGPTKRLIVFATREEYENLKDYIGSPHDRVIITGVGWANVVEALKGFDKNTVIINVGYCGSNSLPIGTKVEVRKCYCYHPHFIASDMRYDDVSFTLSPMGTDCYTSGDFVLETDIKEPVVFDMELYAICSLGFSNVNAIKIVSNNLCLDDYRAAESANANYETIN